MPGTRTQRNVDVRTTGLVGMYADAWTLVFEQLAKDTNGHFAVPALALVATCRTACKEMVRSAAGLITPYDAKIAFVPNGRTRVPVRFHGGVHFAEHRYWHGLSIIRDARTGQMFAASHPAATDTGRCTAQGKRIHEYEVHRTYPLARLAQLLGGHESDSFRRLGGLAQYELSSTPHLTSLTRKNALRNVPLTNPAHSEARAGLGGSAHESLHGVMTKNQLRSYEWTGEPGPLQVNREDFISQRIVRTDYAGVYRSQGDYIMSITEYRQASGKDRVEVSALDQHSSWHGPDCDPLSSSDNAPAMLRPVHVLSRALGYFCEPRVAEGPGWLVSLLSHGCPTYTSTNLQLVEEEDIARMGELARDARQRDDHAKSLPYHPTNNPTGYHKTKKRGLRNRGKRAAAIVAQQRMLSDVPERLSSSEDDDHTYAPPPRRHKTAPQPLAHRDAPKTLEGVARHFDAWLESL